MPTLEPNFDLAVHVAGLEPYWSMLGVLIPLPSASELYRALRCPPSMLFPCERKQPDNAATRGTEIHAYGAALIAEGREAADAVAVSQRSWAATCSELDLSGVTDGRTAIDTEVAYAFDVVSGGCRRIGTGGRRAYASALGAKEIFGTADAVLLDRASDRYVVADLKTGTDVEPAASNAQLQFTALCLAEIHDLGEVIGEIAFIDGTGRVWIDRAVYSRDQLRGFADDLQRLAVAIATGAKAYRKRQPLDTVRGGHCRYCPALAVCPDQAHLARALAASPSKALGAVPGALMGLTPDEVGRAFVRLKELKSLLGAIDRQIYAYIDSLGDALGDKWIPLPGGGRLAMGAVTRDAIDPDIAHKQIAALFGDDVAQQAVERRFTKVALKNALTPLSRSTGQSIPKLMKHFLAAVTAAKGLKKATHIQLKVHAGSGSLPAATAGDEPADE